jgi:hypothetical protein
VCGSEGSVATRLLDLSDSLAAAGRIPAVDDDIETVSRKLSGDRPAKAGCRPGDQRTLRAFPVVMSF